MMDNPWFKAVNYYRELADTKKEMTKLQERYPMLVAS